MGVSMDGPIFEVPPIMSETGKATKFKFCTHILWAQSEQKPVSNFGKSSRGRSQEIFRAPTYRVHRTVIFAIAQLYGFEEVRNKSYKTSVEIMRSLNQITDLNSCYKTPQTFNRQKL